MRFHNIDGNYDALRGDLRALTSDQKRIFIDIKRKTAKETELRIRVGSVGDENAAKLIHDQIVAHLGP